MEIFWLGFDQKHLCQLNLDRYQDHFQIDASNLLSDWPVRTPEASSDWLKTALTPH